MQRRIEPGWRVIGSDGHEIGKVKAAREDHLVVEHGALVKDDYFIPIDEISDIDDGEVALRASASEADREGWQVPPGTHHEKGDIAYPEVPETTTIETAGYSAGTLSAPEAQGFARNIDAEDDVMANRAIDPDADEALDDQE